MCFKGALMGLADLIPGVSGGTIAFALGIHPQLLKSIKSVNLKTLFKPNAWPWFFASALLMGASMSLMLGAHFITRLLNHPVHQEFLRALFLGLVVSSIYFCKRKISKLTANKVLALFLGLVLSCVFSLSKFYPNAKEYYEVPYKLDLTQKGQWLSNYDHEHQRLTHVSSQNLHDLLRQGVIDPKDWVYHPGFDKFVQAESCFEFSRFHFLDPTLIFCGSLSICAMLLPGISGSQVMQMMGHYDTIIRSIALWTKGLSHGQIFTSSFWVLFNLGLGILIGLAFFSRFFIYLYQKHTETMLSLLVGFMLGSLPTLWPFYATTQKLAFEGAQTFFHLERLHPIFPSLTQLSTWTSFLCIGLGAYFLIFLQRFEVPEQDSNDLLASDPKSI